MGLLPCQRAPTPIGWELICELIRRLLDALNEHLIAVGGRVYLAKDAFTRAEHFRAMEPRLDAFLDVRSRWDPERRLRSAQSVRLMGDRP